MRLLQAILAVVALALGCGIVPEDVDTRPMMGISLKPDTVQGAAEVPAKGDAQTPRAVVMLRADSIEMRRVDTAPEAGVELVAEGDVVMTHGADRFHFRRLAFNVETEVWTFELEPGPLGE